MIGSRLKLARNAAGLSLRALAERMEGLVTAQAIGKYERDEMMPASRVLLALAKALKVTPDYLLSQRDIRLGRMEFRKAIGSGAKEAKAVEAKLLERIERYLAVEEALHLRSLNWQAPTLEDVSDPDDGISAAEKLRGRWELGRDPISNMTELLEERGIKVFALKLPQKVFGSTVYSELPNQHVVPAILVNSQHTGERQRFTLAHELGHLVLTFAGNLPKALKEKAVDRFAGAFLVPTDELRRMVGSHRSDISMGELLELKSRFLVSLQTLIVRIGQAAILNEMDTKRHWRQLKATGYMDPPYDEPSKVPGEESHRLHRLVLRAVSEGALSESRGAELLDVSARILRVWLEQGDHAAAA
jgi:Zn-dependent peptidase ImmA (M78 family)/DNA-binding XRE family transcriptional regulator